MQKTKVGKTKMKQNLTSIYKNKQEIDVKPSPLSINITKTNTGKPSKTAVNAK